MVQDNLALKPSVQDSNSSDLFNIALYKDRYHLIQPGSAIISSSGNCRLILNRNHAGRLKLLAWYIDGSIGLEEAMIGGINASRVAGIVQRNGICPLENFQDLMPKLGYGKAIFSNVQVLLDYYYEHTGAGKATFCIDQGRFISKCLSFSKRKTAYRRFDIFLGSDDCINQDFYNKLILHLGFGSYEKHCLVFAIILANQLINAKRFAFKNV